MNAKEPQLCKPGDQFQGKSTLIKMFCHDGHAFFINKCPDMVTDPSFLSTEQGVYLVEISHFFSRHDISPGF
jgi:hypothetical protein